METTKTVFRQTNASDKKAKPLILKWLAKLFNYKDYPHSFKDQWITWNIWDGLLTVSFDLRQEEQVKLLSLIHPRFLGCPQYQTLKIVNEKNFYLDLSRLLHIDYPKISGYKLINKTNHADNDGDTFYTYDWKVKLDDDTYIFYHGQNEKMDLGHMSYTYLSIIQERAFLEFLNRLE